MQDLHEGWGQKLAEEMADLGVSGRELARRVNVSQSTISRIIAGRHCPSDQLKWDIAWALGLRMDELWAWPRVIPQAPYVAA